MKSGILLLIALFIFVGTAQAGLACFSYDKIHEKASSSDYFTKAPAMLMRGMHNVVLSPGELMVNTYKHTKDGKPILGTMKGIGYGAQYMIDRGARGAADIALSLAPKSNGFPPKTSFPSKEI